MRIATPDFPLQIAQTRFNVGAQIDRLVAHFAPAQSGEIEQGVDELAHSLSSPTYAIKILLSFLRESIALRHRYRFSKHRYCANGRPQIVRHGLNERLEIFVVQLE